jgi:DNA modification methylase
MMTKEKAHSNPKLKLYATDFNVWDIFSDEDMDECYRQAVKKKPELHLTAGQKALLVAMMFVDSNQKILAKECLFKTVVEAAVALDISVGSIHQAKKIIESKDLRLIEALGAGFVTTNKAIKVLNSREQPRQVADYKITLGEEGYFYDENTGKYRFDRDMGGNAGGSDSVPFIEIVADECVDVILSDPPYNCSVNGEHWDKGRFDPIGFLDECARIIKPGGSVMIFCSHHLLRDYLSHDPDGLKFQQIIHWCKTNPPVRNKSPEDIAAGRVRDYTYSIEYLLWWTKGDIFTFNADQINTELCGKNLKDTIYVLPICTGDERLLDIENPVKDDWGNPALNDKCQPIHKTLHPTQKPENLITSILEVHSNKGDYVFDPFGGTGTINAACGKLGRRLMMCEKEMKFFRAATKRGDEARAKYWENSAVETPVEVAAEEGTDEPATIQE